MNDLIRSSRKPVAKEFKKWLDHDVLPKIMKYGTYSVAPQELPIKDFYDDHLITDYHNKRVIYLAYIGYYDGEYLCKYGISTDFPRRELNEHRKIFDQFKVVTVIECENPEQIESNFKTELIARNMSRNREFKGKIRKELLALNAVNGIEMMTNLLDRLVGNNTKDNSEIELLKSIIKRLESENKLKDELLESKNEQIKMLKKINKK